MGGEYIEGVIEGYVGEYIYFCCINDIIVIFYLYRPTG